MSFLATGLPINCLKDKPVNEVANPGAEYENSNGADKTIDRNQLETVRLRIIIVNAEGGHY